MGKGPRDKRLGHAGRQASGEGGIRTRGEVAPTQHFQCCTFGRSVTSPKITSPYLTVTCVFTFLLTFLLTFGSSEHAARC